MADYTGVLRVDLSTYLGLVSTRSATGRFIAADSTILPFGALPTRPNAGQLYPRPMP
jgi:hypothetical protein